MHRTPATRPMDFDDADPHGPGDCVTHAQLAVKLEKGRAVMMSHMDDRFDTLETLIKSGFPNGDPVSHRNAHEGMIADADRSRKLWNAVLEKTITSVVWVAMLLVAYALWDYIKAGVHK